MSNIRNFSLKRIIRDLKEINEHPIEGIGIISLKDDPMKYIVNIQLMEGIYKNYCLQLLLLFTSNYPIKPPKILIYPGQIFGQKYHHHIFKDSQKDENGNNFKKFCFDLLENDFLSTNQENTGWNPSYTISSLLLQVQAFLSNPDLPNHLIPNKEQIEGLMKSMEKYERIFIIDNNKGYILHTWKNPYPEMFFKNKEIKEDYKNCNESKIIDIEENRITIIKENLTCFMLKLDYLDEPDIMLGYPIIKNNLDEIYPIPELLSYEGFMEEISKIDNFNNEDVYFKCANNIFYNYWMPIYINDIHFEMNKTTILNSFSIIKFGYLGKKEYDFKSKYIFDILPKMLNNMIISMSNSEERISESFFRCFFHYALLYKKLFQLFRKQYRKYINIYLDKFIKEIKNEYFTINEEIFQKLNYLFILTIFSNEDINCIEMKRIKECLSLIRNMIKNKLLLNLFKTNNEFKMNSSNKFIEDLHTHNIFNEIVELICPEYISRMYLDNDRISKRLKRNISKEVTTSFKKIYLWTSQKTKDKINKIILKNLNFSEYFSFDENWHYLYYKIIETKLKDSFLILIIFMFLKKKIKNDKFIQQIEEDFGIFLDAENTIQEIYHTTDNILQFNDLKYYIGKNFDSLLIEIFTLTYCLKNSYFIDIKLNEYKNDPLYLYVNEIKKTKEPRKIIKIYRFLENRFNKVFIEEKNFGLKCFNNKISIKTCILLLFIFIHFTPKIKINYLEDTWKFFKDKWEKKKDIFYFFRLFNTNYEKLFIENLGINFFPISHTKMGKTRKTNKCFDYSFLIKKYINHYNINESKQIKRQIIIIKKDKKYKKIKRRENKENKLKRNKGNITGFKKGFK